VNPFFRKGDVHSSTSVCVVSRPLTQELCDKHGLPFVQVGFFQCIGEMIVNFNEVRKEFSKCGRGSVALMYT